MRLLLALVLATVGILLTFFLAFTLGLRGNVATWFLASCTALSFILAFVVVDRVLPAPRPPSLAELDALGKLRRDQYRAVRAFSVEEFEDEGVHYFIELDDGRVLYLNGQYLYDYEPDAYGAQSGQPRRFPCTEFALVRDIENGWTVDVECRGTVFEPEFTAPHPQHWPPEFDDGAVIPGESYELLRARFRSPDAA